ncbi:MAG TPA: ribbon-helix-helix domain-containing protein [Anaerolineae bacterium]|nr:ribbon-helix-helix domain-containing protein [Anaerolineae bacterium]
MKTVQMTIDERLLHQVDEAVAVLGTNRSAFIRDALESALKNLQIEQMEKKHRAGYESQPVVSGEFDIWYDEQIWEEE